MVLETFCNSKEIHFKLIKEKCYSSFELVLDIYYHVSLRYRETNVSCSVTKTSWYVKILC